MLLHGDLHHGNILAATPGTRAGSGGHPGGSGSPTRWLAIDPKGVVGEAAYETGALLRNPMPALLTMPHLERVLARRLDRLADELDLDRGRLLGWALAQAVLSAGWTVEDGGSDWQPAIVVAETLAGLA